jgi:type II secretory pathway pseudopilin PulG
MVKREVKVSMPTSPTGNRGTTRSGPCAGPGDESGLTLIEIVAVVAMISFLVMVAAPRLDRFLTDENRHLSLFTGLIAYATDEAFLKNRTVYLTVHTWSPGDGGSVPLDEELREARNGISLARWNREKGVFVPLEGKKNNSITLPDSIRLTGVVMEDGRRVTEGPVFVPIYPDGSSPETRIILETDEGPIEVIRYRYMKEPGVVQENDSF